MKSFLTLGLVLAWSLAAHPAAADDEPDIIAVMGDMQRFLHKLSLSIDAGNAELADFYAHELEEAIEAGESIEKYDDLVIGPLVKSMLVPPFEALEEALDGDEPDREEIDSRLRAVIAACNSCHQATGYGFIHIQRSEANPWMQSFAPRD